MFWDKTRGFCPVVVLFGAADEGFLGNGRGQKGLNFGFWESVVWDKKGGSHGGHKEHEGCLMWDV